MAVTISAPGGPLKLRKVAPHSVSVFHGGELVATIAGYWWAPEVYYPGGAPPPEWLRACEWDLKLAARSMLREPVKRHFARRMCRAAWRKTKKWW